MNIHFWLESLWIAWRGSALVLVGWDDCRLAGAGLLPISHPPPVMGGLAGESRDARPRNLVLLHGHSAQTSSVAQLRVKGAGNLLPAWGWEGY